MDGDPAVEPQLDTFSMILPLPYRIAVILVLGNIHDYEVCSRADRVQQVFGHGPSISTTYLFSELYVDPQHS